MTKVLTWDGHRATLHRRYADGSRPFHERKHCGDGPCPWHSPSKHKMVTWPRSIRFDRSGLVERHCTHGVGHPDPDSLAFIQSKGVNDDGTHGCDGCCKAKKKGPGTIPGTGPLRVIARD